MTPIGFTWAETSVTQHPTTVQLTDGPWVDEQLPIVVLLHGLGPQNEVFWHMSNPGFKPGMNFDVGAPVPALVDRGWHTYPNLGVWSVELDPPKSVTGWQPYLTSLHYSTVNYAQIDSGNLLARPVAELDGLVRELVARK